MYLAVNEHTRSTLLFSNEITSAKDTLVGGNGGVGTALQF